MEESESNNEDEQWLFGSEPKGFEKGKGKGKGGKDGNYKGGRDGG